MRVVYAVGSRSGWPFEVYVLFGNEHEAQRHAHFSAYRFDVFPLPVYDTYEDCPAVARLDDSGISRAMFTLPDDEIEFARLLEHSPEEGAVRGVARDTVYAIGGYNDTEPNVCVLYASAEEARRHVDSAYPHMKAFPLIVYRTYDGCPADARYVTAGGPLSQLVVPK